MARRSRPIFAAKPPVAPKRQRSAVAISFLSPGREVLGMRVNGDCVAGSLGPLRQADPTLRFRGVLPHHRGVKSTANFRIPLRKSAPSVDKGCIHFEEESDFDKGWKGVFEFFVKTQSRSTWSTRPSAVMSIS